MPKFAITLLLRCSLRRSLSEGHLALKLHLTAQSLQELGHPMSQHEYAEG